jgi:uncharacterized repeat protein (TIGR03803 family)
MKRSIMLRVLLASAIMCRLTYAQTATTLYTFSAAPDGASPYAGLVFDVAGNLYGTTIMGGTGSCFNGELHGCGTVFKLDAAGVETVLYSFQSGADGAYPWASLVIDSAGNLYGTTLEGGLSGAGTVFKLDPAGQETILHSFVGSPDGANPYGALIRDGQDNLYGATNAGGFKKCGAGGCGTIFKIDAEGRETIMHRFGQGADGQNPYGNLWRDSTGSLYGTTYRGGALGFGTVYRFNRQGETILYSFQSVTDGYGPEAGVVGDLTGNLYGTTAVGGSNCVGGCGTVFMLDPSGKKTTLHNFTGGSDGELPNASLILDRSGNLFGTTFKGGENGGTAFWVTTDGVFVGAYDFLVPGGPYFSSLIRDSKGHFYGTTNGGGTTCSGGGCGTIFEINFPFSIGFVPTTTKQ